MKSIVVYCGSSEGNDPKVLAEAYTLGKTLARQDIALVYGAAKIGVMGKVAEGALETGGTVVGVIPDFLKKKEVYHPGLSELFVTRNMHERKLKMHELSDGVITLPGGYGTMEELFEMITWAQLGLHQKPIGILNINGFFDPLVHLIDRMVEKGFLKRENAALLLVDTSIDRLLNRMRNYEPIPVPKWIKKEQL